MEAKALQRRSRRAARNMIRDIVDPENEHRQAKMSLEVGRSARRSLASRRRADEGSMKRRKQVPRAYVAAKGQKTKRPSASRAVCHVDGHQLRRTCVGLVV